MWEHPGITPRSEFNIVWCSTVYHAQSSGGRAQKRVWGYFGDVWWFGTLSKTWQLPLRLLELSQLCPIRRDGHPQASLWTGGGVFHSSQLCRGRHWQDKKHYPTSQNFIGFFAHLSQNQLVAKQMFTCHGQPLLHLTAPGLFPCTPSAKHPLLLQMADCLSH